MTETEHVDFSPLIKAFKGQGWECSVDDGTLLVEPEQNGAVHVIFLPTDDGESLWSLGYIWHVDMTNSAEITRISNITAELAEDELLVVVGGDDENPAMLYTFNGCVAEVGDLEGDEGTPACVAHIDSYLKLVDAIESEVGSLSTRFENAWYSARIASGSYLMAQAIAAASGEPDSSSAKRKKQVAEEKRDITLETFAEEVGEAKGSKHKKVASLLEGLNEECEESYLLLIDLAFSQPFAPYDIAVKPDELRLGLVAVAAELGIEEEMVDVILTIQAHERGLQSGVRDVSMLKVGVGLGVLAVVTVLATPAGAGVLGGLGTGLSGAAATAHGLALLGGGSLAAGGFGMAGGLWVLGAAGMAGRAAAMPAIMELKNAAGIGAVREEVVKMQTTIAILHGDDDAKKSSAIESLRTDLEAAEADLATLEKMNDPGSSQTKDAKNLCSMLERAIDSIEKDEYTDSDVFVTDVDKAMRAAGRMGRRIRVWWDDL